MAVVVSKRKISSIQYVDDARKIADQVIERMEKFLDKISKKYKQYRFISLRVNNYLYEQPIKLAVSAYLKVTYANRIYIKSEDDFNRRSKDLKKAIEDYNKLQSIISLLFSHFNKLINQNAIIMLVDFIHNEVNQIKKIIQEDKNKLESIRTK